MFVSAGFVFCFSFVCSCICSGPSTFKIYNFLTNHMEQHPLIGLDRYRAGAQYPILLAAATPIPIPIPRCTKFLYRKCDFVRGIGVCSLYMYAAYMCENTV